MHVVIFFVVNGIELTTGGIERGRTKNERTYKRMNETN
jgi:hypothetical protein